MQEILGYAQTAVSAATMAAVLVIAILAKMYIERLLKRLEAMLGGSAQPDTQTVIKPKAVPVHRR